MRFDESPTGRRALEEHLDGHFRRNIRSKDKARRVVARLWMQNEHDWMNNVEAKESEQAGKWPSVCVPAVRARHPVDLRIISTCAPL